MVHIKKKKKWEALKSTPLSPCPTLISLQAIRQAVAETVEELKMKPMMLNLVEA